MSGNWFMSEEKRVSEEIPGRCPCLWVLHEAAGEEVQQQYRNLDKGKKGVEVR